jgi:hypothetical protein
MSEPDRLHAADIVGLQIQELYTNGSLRGSQPLLRIDNREQARRAPFQIDAATGRLHRRTCRSIPKGSRSALYGVWRIGKDEETLACPRCKPMPETEKNTEDPEYPTDLLYGVLSVVNQFGGVLRERGQEYRKSNVGKVLSTQIDVIYRGINERERNILDVVLTSLDQLASTIRDLDTNLNTASDANGVGAHAPGGNGQDVKKDRQKKGRRRPPSGSQ